MKRATFVHEVKLLMEREDELTGAQLNLTLQALMDVWQERAMRYYPKDSRNRIYWGAYIAYGGKVCF